MEPTTLSGPDQAVVACYLAITMAVGLSYARRPKTSESYYLAGRTLTLPAFVATLVATWYGGILGVGEYAYQSGLSTWIVFGVPYYVFAAVFAVWLAPRIRGAELYTIPDKIAASHGRAAGLVAALFCYLMTNPAAYVLMLGILLQLAFGLPPLAAMLVGLVLSTVYVYSGGFQADVRVNILQFGLMFAGFILLLAVCVTQLGGPGWVAAQVPPTHLTWHGGNSPGYIAAWFFIALWTLVDPGFHQRCYAAKDGATARRGVLVSIGCWFVFDFLTCTTGLYARAALPDIEPAMAYPLLAQQVLPKLLLGFFHVAMLATVMSTLVSYTFLCGVTFSRDIVWRLRGGEPDRGVAVWTAVGLVVTSLLALTMAVAVPSVVDIWYDIGTVFVPGLLLPLLLAYFATRRLPRGVVAVAMVAASGTSLGWLVWGHRHAVEGWPSYPWGVQPLYPGLAVSAVLLGAGWRVASARG